MDGLVCGKVQEEDFHRLGSFLLLPDYWWTVCVSLILPPSVPGPKDRKMYCIECDARANTRSNVYGPTFYRELGFGNDRLFAFQTIGQSIGVVASIIGIVLIDKIGRRPPVLFGACLLFVCNILIGSLGSKQDITTTQEGVIIASIMLLLSGLKLSFQLSSCKSTAPLRWGQKPILSSTAKVCRRLYADTP